MAKRDPEQRKGGRPRREDGPKMPYHEADRLLVEGELVAGADGAETRVWPSQREVAMRFKVAPSLVAAFAKQSRCDERKAAFHAGTPIEPITLKDQEAAPAATTSGLTPLRPWRARPRWRSPSRSRDRDARAGPRRRSSPTRSRIGCSCSAR